ncbi:MAG TPA: phosphotransferase [Candidatus Nanoarchaeia archaeon]|nr:phosphotransferase [Candidatus Nanoarchaeia archaeon]
METKLHAVSIGFALGVPHAVERLTNGLLHASYKVATQEGIFVLQRLHPVFDTRVNNDYQRVQRYLRTNGIFVPLLLQSVNGPSFLHEGEIWRAFEYIPHDAVTMPTPVLAREAGCLLGRFHLCMDAMDFRPSFKIEGYRDTPAFLVRLHALMRSPSHALKRSAARKAYEFIAANIERHYLSPSSRQTLIHGDPKLDNFLFRDNKAIALLDLDTMMRAPLLLDLGDALRSWCRIKPSTARFREDIFTAALEGYRSANPFTYSDDEVKSAMGLITLELATRYLIDYFEESYFTLKKEKYESLAEQNLTRCYRYIDYYKNFMGIFL